MIRAHIPAPARRWAGQPADLDSHRFFELGDQMRPLRVLTWHVHGNYLLYLSRARVNFILPVDPALGAGYGGRGSTFPFGSNVIEVPAGEIRNEQLDCVLFQTRKNWEQDQYDILSPAQ